MDLFNTKKKLSVVEEHQAISNDAFSMFNETLDKLANADTLLNLDIDIAEAEIQEAKNKKKALIDIQTRNNKLSANIKKFFEGI